MMPKTVITIGDVSETDTSILLALNRFNYLTAAQANRLLYPDNRRDDNRYMQRRLAKLVATGYVMRLRNLPTPRFGSSPHVFTLATRGRQYLTVLGIETPAYFRPSEES